MNSGNSDLISLKPEIREIRSELKATNTGAFVQGEESPSVQFDWTHPWGRSLPEKIMAVNFVAQVFMGFSYGLALFLVNQLYPGVTQWLAQHLSAVTDPVARYLPIAIYADRLANPQLGLSAMLIRHVFSFLMLINLVSGVIFFALYRKLAAGYSQILNTNPAAVKRSIYVFAFLGAVSCYALFVGPVIQTGMDDLWYLYACIAPPLHFFSVFQVVADVLAYWNRYLKGP